MLTLLLKPLHAVAASFADWQRRQQAIAELASLDDRSLADMGITRSDIPYIMSQVAYDGQAAKAKSTADTLRHAA